MKKLFIKLYAVLAIAIIVFILGVVYLPDFLLRSTITAESQRLTSGSFYLLQQALAPLPIEQWQRKIKQLQPHFGYPLQLKSIDTIKLKTWEMENLQQGLAVISRHDDADHWYQRIADSEYVFVVGMEETKSIRGERQAQGSFYLVQQQLKQLPVEQWGPAIDELQKAFGFPIALIGLDETALEDSAQERLRQGYVVGLDIGEQAERFFKRIDNSHYVMYAGPTDTPMIFEILNYIIISIFSMVIALVIFFWIKPLWRDIAQLNAATNAFGRGEFDTRANLSNRSALVVLANTFNDMAGRIQGLLNSHKELTNAVAHEIRTPIARLRFGLEMAHNSTDVDTYKRHLHGMGADIDELDNLVAELLTYARLDRDTPDLTLSRQKILPWLNGVISSAQVGNGSIEIRCHSEQLTDASSAILEPKLMARALSNLLQNAKHYAKRDIDVHLKLEDGDCLLIIDDDGPGIPAAQRTSIFDPFTRLDASRDRETGGYGLGLAIVQRIASCHKGEVIVDDAPSGGARFIIRWPGVN